MKAFTIPTIFTAIDKTSSVVKFIGNGIGDFASKAQGAIARSERWFRKLTPVLSETSKQVLSFASSAAIAGAIIGGITFSTSSLMDYEDAVLQFRTIVSDLTDTEFAKYQEKINEVGKDTKTSSVLVAQSFEKIAGLNSKFAETSEGLGAVSKSAIILSKASKEELGTSAENLVGIMNQFSLGAMEADRTINVLAAGQAVGAANISNTSEAFKNFGSVASGANISLEESVALIQTLAQKQILGAEAGTKLRGSVLKLQQAGVGYASGQFNINDALTEASKKIDKLKTAKQKDAALTKMFGAENIATGRILLSSIDTYKEFTKGVTGTNEAQKAAAINSQSLRATLGELSAAWVNMLTSSENAGTGLNSVKTVIRFVTDNLHTIVTVGASVLGFFVAWKIAIWASKASMIAYNVVLGLYNAITGRAVVYTAAQTVAMNTQNIATKAITAAQWLWNASVAAFPVFLIIAGIVALIAVVYQSIQKWNEWGAAVSFLLGPLGFVISLIQSFRRNWDMVKDSFATGGILEGFKAIGKVIFDAVLMPIQQVFKLLSNIPGMGDFASKGAANVEAMRKALGVNTTTDESGETLAKPAVSTKVTEAETRREEIEKIQSAKLTIEDQTGKGKLESSNPWITMMPKTTSTLAGFGR